MIDTSSFRRFADVLRRHSVELAGKLDEHLLEAGKLVADEAKSRVSAHSTKVPGTVRVEPREHAVAVVAGGSGVPIAGLFERGNKGRGTTPSTFRHPVFGNSTVWVTQPAHPFLRPALASKRSEIVELTAGAVEETIHAICVESEV